MNKYDVNDVFVPGGVPHYTYIRREDKSLESPLCHARKNLCKLVTVTGPTKSGKTVLVSRVFDENDCIWIDGGTISSEDDFWDTILLSLNEYTNLSVTERSGSNSEIAGGVKGGVGALLIKGEGHASTKTSRSKGCDVSQGLAVSSRIAAIRAIKSNNIPVVIDDFHYIDSKLQGSIVKAFKSLITKGLPVIVIAVPHRRYDVVRVEKEMTGRVQQLEIPEWEQKELIQIPKQGFKLLNISSEESSLQFLAREAYGSPHLMQEFCRYWANENGITETTTSNTSIPFPSFEIFSKVAKNTGKYIFDKLANGSSYKGNRIQRPLKNGGSADLYELMLLAIANITTGTGTVAYGELRESIKSLLSDNVPRKSEITRGLRKLSEIASSDNTSVPVLEWDSDEELLHITDPFFAFYLKYGLQKPVITPVDSFISDYMPLGPLVSEDFNSKYFERFVDTENQLYKALRSNPTVLIGRKGSGKSTLLRSAVVFNANCITVEIDTSEAFSLALSIYANEVESYPFTELVAELWERIVWEYIFRELQKSIPSARSHLSLNDVVLLLSGFSQSFRGKATVKKLDEDSRFREEKDKVIHLLENEKKRVLVLIDSLETLDFAEDIFARLFSGFVKFAGAFSRQHPLCEIRYALPAETYRNVMAISSNPNKDFSRALTLTWTGAELSRIAARRYAEYLKEFEPGFYEKIISELNIKNRKDSSRFWEYVFPNEVTNKLGAREKVLPFILRHTQLNPRQVIMYINEIISNGIDAKKKRYGFASQQIVVAVRNSLGVIAREVFFSYGRIYPRALEVCEHCLPHLNNLFTNGELEKVFRRHGKRAAYMDDYFDFKRMLIEMGIIGVVVNDAGKYIEAEFEYTMPHDLITSTENKLCVHPIFEEFFTVNVVSRKPIYPRGSSTAEIDYR